LDTSLSINLRTVSRRAGNTIGPLRMHADATGVTLIAIVRDVSILGIGLIVDQSIEPGTLLLIKEGPRGDSLLEELSAKVCHSTALQDGRWHLGCAFSRTLTVADLEALG